MDSVSDDDDLVDRSLDIAPDMEEASDVESGSQSEGEQGQAEEGEDDMQAESEEEEEDKENEPLEPSEQEEEERGDMAHVASSIPSSPTRAVSFSCALLETTLLRLPTVCRFVDPW